ncbi:MAG: citrate synthase/methylcitrate synthase, partial [Thermoplasmata archaeon]|nr:citrate synthase/methylcitrate synthase [Thermoplasmata archaeon]
EVVYLLLHGDPPSDAQAGALRADLVVRRSLPAAAVRVTDGLSPTTPPLDALRTSLSALGDGTIPYPPTLAQGLDLIARTPLLLARHVRRAAGAAPVEPRPDLGHAAHYLYLLRGEEARPPQVHALEQYLVLLADHGMNASTFALRVVLSTNSDLVSAAVAALAALKGPAHGGAPSKVSDMLDAVGAPENAERWVRSQLDAKTRLMGFGHRAYKTEDPRAVILHRLARKVGDPGRFALAEAVERAALDELHRRKPDQRLYTNVEYYSAVVLEAVGLPRELFTPTFAVARTAGWAAHALEQAADNRLIRPDVHYAGPAIGRTWPSSVPRA